MAAPDRPFARVLTALVLLALAARAGMTAWRLAGRDHPAGEIDPALLAPDAEEARIAAFLGGDYGVYVSLRDRVPAGAPIFFCSTTSERATETYLAMVSLLFPQRLQGVTLEMLQQPQPPIWREDELYVLNFDLEEFPWVELYVPLEAEPGVALYRFGGAR